MGSRGAALSELESDRPVCWYEGEDFGRSGLAARQFTGPGPKGRIVVWNTPDFIDPKAPEPEQAGARTAGGTTPRLAVQVAWRVTEVNGAFESILESLRVHAVDVAESDRLAAADWEFLVVDGERYMAPVTTPVPADLRERFVSDQTAGIRLPGLVAESMGGVNGGRFTVQVLDAEGLIIADRDVRPPRGYEFKERAEAVLVGLDARLADPSGCGGPASHDAEG
ncbi:MAG: hypothetical protein MUF14_09750 [Hyphomonadaceae bacterium]|nr:hypothetical protein [Hyphomonadaceae bacterium]